MNDSSSFLIYNASAGSGKTFTLVKEYLKILIKSNNSQQFRHILAITFTNKAASEMKVRIIETLKAFSSDSIFNDENPMFKTICEELNITEKELYNRSKKTLDAIMYNYAAFNISTIDGFTHKLIRTFAYDLKLPLNFEVELDQDTMLVEAVDRLISKAGTDKKLTEVLVNFAIEKADDDKSWDVSFDFNKIAKLLVNENDLPFIEALKNKTLEDFKALKKLVKKELLETENTCVEIAKNTLVLIDECGLQYNDFTRSSLPKHFDNISNKKLNVSFDSGWQTNLTEGNTLYPKRVSTDIASTIDTIQPKLAQAFVDTKRLVFHYKFLLSFYKNITPLSVLNAINNELLVLKDEQNKMLISEFNAIISDEIKNQPTPFIYERLGEKINHYFIDEFQDTSFLQWKNLVPLLDNSLSRSNGGVMLVGDAKQAIYRWRGGKAEQFIDLYNNTKNPFQQNPQVLSLNANYRSFKEIINFNNLFFNYLSSTFFNSVVYADLYANASQQDTASQQGYVNLNFLDFSKEDDRDTLYTEETLKTIKQCLDNGYKFKDITVLVRKKKEGVAIADYLSSNDIPIMSSETLLLKNSPEVVFIHNILKLILQPDNNELKVAILIFLSEKLNISNTHSFLKSHAHLETSKLFKSLESFQVFINIDSFALLPLYEIVETIIRTFKLVQTSNAYVQFYLDLVLEYSQKQTADIAGFVSYFEKKENNLSIVTPEGQNAVQIMTIHKSKGLEFPVVIFPYADLNIYNEKEPKEWMSINPDIFNGFSHTLLNYNKDFEFFGDEGYAIYNKHQSELELDNINLLYVALTRASEQLYIIAKHDINSKGEISNKTYSGLLINYLQSSNNWVNNQLNYSFGNPQKESSKKEDTKTQTQQQQEFISTNKQDHNIKIVTSSGYLWDTKQKDAIEKGLLVHNIMAEIKTDVDIDFALNDFLNNAIITKPQQTLLKDTILHIVQHPNLKTYFTSNNTIYNERDIICSSGKIIRPDRLVITPNNEAIIIDYKTGAENNKYQYQLEEYETALNEMKIKTIKKILVYINEDITVKEF
ncbi:UvrD-helicase domain-containing protein [Corallibacter sp.]|uniref:UvrD-helicase domain-containing protein n=1 Tax=Corallibacter sp. TaxID=2038084 RepID=UPI003AB6A4AE